LVASTFRTPARDACGRVVAVPLQISADRYAKAGIFGKMLDNFGVFAANSARRA
jgi:hypothetical protein